MPGASRYCTEWGYFIGGAPDPLPTLVSRLIDVAYNARICEYAFPPGKHSSVPSMPNVTRINQYGDYALKASRLAIIDGDEDPWIFATAHSPDAVPREDTLSEPYKIIKGVRCLKSFRRAYAEYGLPQGVHHYDEYGNDTEPAYIAKIHQQQIAFVKEWLREYAAEQAEL